MMRKTTGLASVRKPCCSCFASQPPMKLMRWRKKYTRVEHVMMDLTTHPNWPSRMKAAQILGNIRDSRATAPLIQALGDVVWEVQQSAIEALGKRRDIAAIGALIHILESAHRPVRTSAVEALGRIGTPAIGPLLEALSTKNLDRREGVVAALGKIGDTQAVPFLMTLLKQEKNWAIRNKAVWALGEIADDRAKDVLHEIFRNSMGDIRKNAAEALQKIGTPILFSLVSLSLWRILSLL